MPAKLTRAFICIMLSSTPAFADTERLAAAQALFEQGKQHAADGKWEQACQKFEASIAADESPSTWGQLAICYEHVDRNADAWAAWQRVKVRATRDDQRTYATQRMLELEPNLSYLKIEIAEIVPGMKVERDGRELLPGEIADEIPVNRGKHVIVVSAPGRESVTKEIVVAVREHASLQVEPLPIAVERKPVGFPWRSTAFVGAGVLGLGISGLVGLSARGERDTARQLGCNADLTSCNLEGFEHARTATSRARLATGMAIGGAALIATGVAFYFLSSDHKWRKERYRVALQPSASGMFVTLGGDL